jgi:hypothetical protein
MDPYLEGPEFFPGLHDRLIHQISDALQAILPPPYYAEIGSRIWFEYPDHSFEPDAIVSHESQPAVPCCSPVDVLVPADAESLAVEVRDIFVEIRTIPRQRSSSR